MDDRKTTRPRTPSAVMQLLWVTAAPHMSREDLEWLIGATEEARAISADLSHVIEGVGCLIASDANVSDRAGNFQGADILELLLIFARTTDAVAGMIAIGTEATGRLKEMDANYG